MRTPEGTAAATSTTLRGALRKVVARQPRSPATHVEWSQKSVQRLRAIRPLSSSLPDVERALRIGPDELISLAYGQRPGPRGVLVTIVPIGALPWLRVPVRVECRTPLPEHRAASSSFRWQATRFARWLPVLEADLVARPDGGGRASVVLDGAYQAPLGLFGLLLDRAVGHLVAVSTVRSFVDRLGEEIDRAGAGPA